jgi:hypothetical protein
MKLVGTDALFTAAHQMEALHPFMQGDVAALHRRVHRHGEILAADRFRAAEGAGRLNRVGVIDDAAMGTNRTIWPA